MRRRCIPVGLLKRNQSGEDPVSRDSAILSREALAHLDAFPLLNGTWIDETYVVYEKTSSGLSFTMSVGERQLDNIVEQAGTLAILVAHLAARGSDEGTVVVGRYYAGDAIPECVRDPKVKAPQGIPPSLVDAAADSRGKGKDSVWWPVVDDPRLSDFVDRAARFLDRRLEKLGCWSSFVEWAECEAGADLTASTRGPLAPLDYWWLVGETRAGQAIHRVPIYPPEYGLYVPPDDGLIRIYSCMMKAALAQVAYSRSSGLDLQTSPVHCLGCFLGGSAKSIGRAALRGGLLDERWRIDYATCERHGRDRPSHFAVSDRGEDYDLVGCKDHGAAPVWVRRAWNTTPPHPTAPWV